VIQLVGTDAMTYSLATITAKPGEVLKVVLKTTSNFPPEQLKHNFVLLKPETDAMAFAVAAVMAKDTGYIPVAEKDKILEMTGMAANGEEVSATFKAPAKPGTYPYVCTFPGHFFAGMKGNLIVK
jgi:azurin